MELRRGNSAELVIGPIQDPDGTTIETLASAEAIRFVVAICRRADDDDIVIDKSLDDGVIADDPNTGYVTIAVTAAESEDLDLSTGKYYMALKITWPDGNTQEVELNDEILTIKKNIIAP